MPGAYIPDPDFEKEIQDSAQPKMAAAAESAAENARGVAPRLSGDYEDSIEAGVDPDGNVILTATDWKAHFIEFGTVDTPTFAPLRRGVIGAGLRFQPDR